MRHDCFATHANFPGARTAFRSLLLLSTTAGILTPPLSHIYTTTSTAMLGVPGVRPPALLVGNLKHPSTQEFSRGLFLACCVICLVFARSLCAMSSLTGRFGACHIAIHLHRTKRPRWLGVSCTHMGSVPATGRILQLCTPYFCGGILRAPLNKSKRGCGEKLAAPGLQWQRFPAAVQSPQ